MIIFGGIFEVTKELNDLYAYSIEDNRWILLQEDPYAVPVHQRGHSAQPKKEEGIQRSPTITEKKRSLND